MFGLRIGACAMVVLGLSAWAGAALGEETAGQAAGAGETVAQAPASSQASPPSAPVTHNSPFIIVLGSR